MLSSKPLLRIFLARHGQSKLNLEQRLSGQIDASLSDKGLEQAQALSQVLRHEPLTAIYASSLQRARHTAIPTAASHGLPITRLDTLREIGLGTLEGRYIDQRDEEACRLWAERSLDKFSFMAVGGESYPDFRERVLSGLEQILAKSSGAILIVGHRNTNEIILSRLLAGEMTAVNDINIKNKYLYEIQCTPVPCVTTIRLGGEHHGQRYQGLRT